MIGDPAPRFRGHAVGGNPVYTFDTAAGRPILMLFAGHASRPAIAPALELLRLHRTRFDDRNASFFGVSIDPTDVTQGRIAQIVPGIRWFLDADRTISTAYGALKDDTYRAHWLLLDRTLRVAAIAKPEDGARMIAALDLLNAEQALDTPTPVLLVPRVLEPTMCLRLIDLYKNGSRTESGFMREIDGMTVEVVDHALKRRSDVPIEDEALCNQLRIRIKRFLLPQIQHAFQFTPTRVERYIVARYDGDGGYFGPHRDNTTKGTAHRRFACTINLNAEDYDGGELRFPEYGPRTWRAPTGGAIVFSCSMLHEATPVTRGERYAFLPFLYDEAGAELREANLKYLAANPNSQDR